MTEVWFQPCWRPCASRMNWCNSFAQQHAVFPAHQIRSLDSFDIDEKRFIIPSSLARGRHCVSTWKPKHLVDIWCFLSQYKHLTSGVAYKALSRLMFEMSFKGLGHNDSLTSKVEEVLKAGKCGLNKSFHFHPHINPHFSCLLYALSQFEAWQKKAPYSHYIRYLTELLFFHLPFFVSPFHSDSSVWKPH